MNDNSFQPIDRLIEFGLSMAVAQQMTSSFNQIINNAQTPRVPFPGESSRQIEWYYAVDGNIAGPANEAEVKNLLLHKRINNATMMWKQGMQSWKQAVEIPEILNYIMQLPPAL